MKKIFLTLAFLVLAVVFISNVQSASAATRIRGYVRKGTGYYVMPHYRSTRDSFKFNNYSSRGNVNPFTGKKGYKSW